MPLPTDLPNDPLTAKLQGTTTLIERVIALSVFAALLVGVALVLRPFITGILFGTILVIATWPLREWFHRRGLPTFVTATVLLLAAIVTIGAPAVLLAPGLGERLVEGIQRVQEYFAASPELPSWIAKIPFASDAIGRLWSDLRSPESIFQQVIMPYSAELRRLFTEIARAFAEGVFQLVVALAVATMFWMRGDALAEAVKEITERLGGSTAGAALQLAADSVRGVAYGIVGTAAMQAIAMTLGLYRAGVPGAGLLGFVGRRRLVAVQHWQPGLGCLHDCLGRVRLDGRHVHPSLAGELRRRDPVDRRFPRRGSGASSPSDFSACSSARPCLASSSSCCRPGASFPTTRQSNQRASPDARKPRV